MLIPGHNRPADRDDITVYAEWKGSLRVGARADVLELLVVEVLGDYVACVLREAQMRPPRKLIFRLEDGAQVLPDDKLGGWELSSSCRMLLRSRGAA